MWSVVIGGAMALLGGMVERWYSSDRAKRARWDERRLAAYVDFIRMLREAKRLRGTEVRLLLEGRDEDSLDELRTEWKALDRAIDSKFEEVTLLATAPVAADARELREAFRRYEGLYEALDPRLGPSALESQGWLRNDDEFFNRLNQLTSAIRRELEIAAD